MKRQLIAIGASVVLLFISILSITVHAAEVPGKPVDLLTAQTAWRVHLTQGCNLFYDKGDKNVVRTTEWGNGWKPFDKTARLFSPRDGNDRRPTFGIGDSTIHKNWSVSSVVSAGKDSTFTVVDGRCNFVSPFGLVSPTRPWKSCGH